jgi:hypothetical protein
VTPPNLGKWADGDPLPNGAQLRGAGFIGALVYGGTPGRPKNTYSAQRLDLQSAGLQLAAVYENTSTDINGGAAAGSAHADALITDLINCGYTSTLPVCVAADEHLTASQTALGVQYQTGFYQRIKALGWRGPVGGYGFSEYTQAIHNAGVADWLWQCGSQSALWSGAHFWQDNTGIDNVANIAVDRDWQLQALPVFNQPAAGGDMPTQTRLPATDTASPPVVTDTASLVVDGCTKLWTQTEGMTQLVIENIWFWGPTPAAPSPANDLIAQVTGPLTIDAVRSGPWSIPSGTVQAEVQYASNHAWTLGAS